MIGALDKRPKRRYSVLWRPFLRAFLSSPELKDSFHSAAFRSSSLCFALEENCAGEGLRAYIVEYWPSVKQDVFNWSDGLARN